LGASDALRAVAFDARRAAVRGQPFTVLDSVAASGTVESLAMAPDGTAVYSVVPGFQRRRSLLALVDLTGREQRLPLPEGVYGEPRFSPDGRRVAVVSGGETGTLLVHDLESGATTRPVASGARDLLWTPAGALIYCGPGGALMSTPADGLGRTDTLYRGDRCPLPRSISPDGKQLLLQTYEPPDGSWDLSVAALDTILGPITDYLSADWFEGVGDISPDGRWVVYTSGEQQVTDESAGTRIYATSFPGPGRRFPVSDMEGNYPTWAPDGRTIYYWRDSTLVAASVQTSPAFAVTDRRDVLTRGIRGGFDVHPDGGRFVVALPTSTAPAAFAFPVPRLVMVVNWLDEFERKAGASR